MANQRPGRLMRGILLVTALTGATLGCLGFFFSMPEESLGLRLLLSVVGTAQLFILGVDVSDLISWPLQLAALICPAATATAAWVVFAAKLGDWWLRVLNKRNPPYAVVLGGGHLATLIARHYEGEGRIIIVDSAEHAEMGNPERFGTDVVYRVGDCLSPTELKTISAYQTKRVWIATGDDRKNIEILKLLHHQLTETDLTVTGRQWFIDLNRRELLRYAANLEDKWRIDQPLADIDTIQFNLERMIAREALKFCFCDPSGPEKQIWQSRSSRAGFHIVVIGNGDLSEQLVLHAIQYLVVDEQPKCAPSITWFGSGVQERERKLLDSFPILDPTVSTLPHLQAILPVARLQAIDVDELRLSPRKWAQAQSVSRYDLVIIAATDEQTQSLVLRQVLGQLLCIGNWSSDPPTPVVVVSPTSESSGSSSLLRDIFELSPEIRQWLYAFDSAQIWRRGESYPGAECDQSAKQLHAHFNQDRLCAGETVEEIWKSAKEFERWSSRYAADHREIHRRLSTMQSPSSNILEAIARVEHRRFVVERLMDGWLPPRRDNLKINSHNTKTLKSFGIHPDLVPWDDLSSESRSRQATLSLVEAFITQRM